jgi:hypothetical protein
MSIMELADEAALYSGQIQDAYDEETGLFNMRVETADELDLVKNINYVTTFTEDSESYMLEKEMLTEGWEEDKFSKAPYETWYSVNDKPITANIDGHENYMDTEGYEVYNYAIPAVTVDENGEEISVELNCMYLDAPDLTAVADNDIAKCNKMLVVGVTPVSDDEIAPRVLDPDDEMQIKLMLAEYDPESCSVTGYKTYDEAISLTALDEDTYILPCEKKVLVNNDNVSYISYFEVTDVQNNVYLSDRMEYDSFQNTDAGYTDVSSDAWYAQSVKYVTEKGLMSGIGNNKFAPETPLSRNMLVTILYRMEGEPTVTAKGSFKDILPGSYYENAVEWAAENGIVSGYTADRFEPYADITREQLATILWRYAKHKGIDVSVGENTAILGYTDAADVSGYAVPAMQWACGAGIISGIGGSLVPNGSATRAQTAVILERMN